MKKYQRICPNPNNNPFCKQVIYYSRHDAVVRANKNNNTCRSCSNYIRYKTEFNLSEDGRWIRLCPNPTNNFNCKKEIYYTSKQQLNWAEKHNYTCLSCGQLKRTDDYKEKLKLRWTGKGNPNYNKTGSLNHRYGTVHSPETINLMKSASQELWENNEERRQHFKEMNTGKNNPMYGITGSTHHNWNPNKTDEERLTERNYDEYRQFTKEVLEERNYTCEITGQIGGQLNIHHLKSYAKYPDLRIDKSNVILITEDLHEEFHTKYGKINFTDEDFFVFIRGKYEKTQSTDHRRKWAGWELSC